MSYKLQVFRLLVANNSQLITKNIMALKIGDRVRFLNSTGGGIVQKFINKDMVSVMEDDGFETPTLIRECVVIAPLNPPEEGKRSDVASSSPSEKLEEIVLFEETPEGERLSVSLAFLPQDIKKIQSTDFEFYLINDSNYNLYYTVSSVINDKAQILENGIIHLNTTLFLREIAKEELNDYEKINVQFVAFKSDKNYDIKPSVSLTLKTKLVNFYKLHSFTVNEYFDEPAMLMPIITNDRLELPVMINQEDFLKQKLNSEKPENKTFTQAKSSKNEVVEVDLHIHELLDNTSGLSAKDMLDYQLKIFNEVLSENKNRKGQRIVFIHGKGNGVLRNELIKELKSKYPAFTYQDASFKEYGFGATMIVIK
jgi:hypothetical protein